MTHWYILTQSEAILWLLQPQRIASDLKLAKELAAKLDAEKGVAENPLLADDAPTAQPGGAAPAPMEDGSPVSGGDDAPPATAMEDGEEASAEAQVRPRRGPLPGRLLPSVSMYTARATSVLGLCTALQSEATHPGGSPGGDRHVATC